MEDIRPEARLRSKLLVRIFRDTDSRLSDVPYNVDHSLGCLMFGDPANHLLGGIYRLAATL